MTVIASGVQVGGYLLTLILAYGLELLELTIATGSDSWHQNEKPSHRLQVICMRASHTYSSTPHRRAQLETQFGS